MSDNDVSVEEKEWEFEDFDPPVPVFIAELQAALELVPPEYRHTTWLQVSCRERWEECTGELTMYYARPKTPEELRREYEATEAGTRERMAREYAEYERLRAKFGKA